MVLHQNLYGSIDAFPLLAIPFFIYAGELMGRGTVAQRLVDVVQAGVGKVPGSLGVTTVGTSAIFGAISGASAATVATVGRIMVPAMRRAGYPEAFSAGVIILGGIYGGVFSPTEAAGIACVYAAFVTRVVYRDIPWREILDAAGSTAIFTSQILIIVACASVFSWLLTVNQVPAALVAW